MLIPVNKPGMNLIQFFNKNVEFKTNNDLLMQFDNYVDHNFPNISHTFLSHHYTPDPYGIEILNSFSTTVYDLLNNIKVNLDKQKYDFITIHDLNIFPIQSLANKVDFLIIFASLSEPEKNELYALCEKLQALYQLLLKQKEKIEALQLNNQANLISQYSHDLNSLLVLMNEEKLRNQRIRSKVEYLEKLSQDMLQYIRELDIYKSIVNVNELLTSIISYINISGETDFQYSIENNLGSAILDVELISTAILKIVDNAIRAANQRGGKIEFIANKKCCTSIFFNTTWLQITISDNGPGIPDEFLSLITNPFFTTFKDQGYTGFGLSLVHKIVLAHDGLLKIEKNKSVGTRVILFLPLDN